MKITNENLDLRNFNAWCGAKETKQTIIDNNKESEFESLIEVLYPDGLTDTRLNDLLWFDGEWVFEQLGINIENDEDEN